MIQQHEALMQR